MTSRNQGFGDFTRQPLVLEGNMAVARAVLGLLKRLICFIHMF